VAKILEASPVEIQKRYEKWKDIVAISGPQGLRVLRGFNDEALSGKWKGFRSSRLNVSIASFTAYRMIKCWWT